MTTDLIITRKKIYGRPSATIKFTTPKGHLWLIKSHYKKEVTIHEEFLEDYLKELDKEGITYEIT